MNTPSLSMIRRSAASIDAFDEQEVARVSLQAFFSLAEHWQLRREEAQVLLGSPSESTYYRWKQGRVANIPRDTVERISVMVGIYKALHILFPVTERADGYLRRENSDFDGQSALAVMLRGNVEHLYEVRRYLDAWRG